MNNYILIIFDSCRYDSFIAAAPTFPERLGTVQKRWSYASWTAPSHYNLMSGLLPHTSPAQVYASEYYKEEFLCFNQRLGTDNISFKQMVPDMYLPTFLKRLGYTTNALVSMPVLNPKTTINRDFDRYEMMMKHNDMRAMLPKITFSEDQPSFYLLNIGETHYPYALPDENPRDWPKISGVHGVFKKLDEGGEESAPFFDQDKLEELRQRQIRAVQHLDGVMHELLDRLPQNTYVTVTADHGELFGEAGYFGHGPIQHDKVFEVPFVEGPVTH